LSNGRRHERCRRETSFTVSLGRTEVFHSGLHGPDPDPAKLERRSDQSSKEVAKESYQAKSRNDHRRPCATPGCDSSHVPDDSGCAVRTPRLANTDGDPLALHTLKFRIESPEKAFEALAPLTFGQSKEEILQGATFSQGGKLWSIEFDWCKKGNAKIPSWDNVQSPRLDLPLPIEGQLLSQEQDLRA